MQCLRSKREFCVLRGALARGNEVEEAPGQGQSGGKYHTRKKQPHHWEGNCSHPKEESGS